MYIGFLKLFEEIYESEKGDFITDTFLIYFRYISETRKREK